MKPDSRLAVPDPDEQPEAFRERAYLKNLYIDRGWTREQIAEYFDATIGEVRSAIDEHDLNKGEGTHPPNQGLAAQLWKHGRQEAIR